MTTMCYGNYTKEMEDNVTPVLL